MICLHCMFSRHRKNALRKAEEWDDTACMRTVYISRASKIEQELLNLKCTCSDSQEISQDVQASG